MTPHPSIMIRSPIFILICWLCSKNFVFAEGSPMVHVKNGTLEGTIMMTRKGRELFAFRGIPYAQPPLGKLRFEPPKQFHSWTGVRSAKKDANICIQRDVFSHQEQIVGVEDCLYLNVYSPKLLSHETDASQTNYPVMIHFHGGAWLSGGSNSSYLGPKFLLDHDVILVTLNYRLGPLGFLSTEDLASPGNQGMKDQVQAIKWVHENIAAFSGDPNRITIFGESSGASSVQYQMISPLSRGLVHRVISASGSVLCPWALIRPGIAKIRANMLGKLLDCPTDKSATLVECLRKKDAVDIIATDRAFQVFDYCPIPIFGPVIEPDHAGAFLKEDPAQSLKSGNMADIPWMTGVTSHEGAMKVSSIFGQKDKQYDKLLDEKFMEIAPITLGYEHTCPEKLKDNVTRSIREFYLRNEKIDESKKWSLIDLYADAWFVIGVNDAIKDHFEALSSPVYYYLFAYKGSCTFTDVFGHSKEDYGVSHVDDIQYIFPMGEIEFPDTPLSKEDNKIIDLMTRLWTNFAKSGNPTPEITSEIPIKWKPVRTSKLEYLRIGHSKNLHMTDNMFSERVNFWASIPHRGKIVLNDDVHRIKDEL